MLGDIKGNYIYVKIRGGRDVIGGWGGETLRIFYLKFFNHIVSRTLNEYLHFFKIIQMDKPNSSCISFQLF